MDETQIWSLTYGIEDIPEDHREAFLAHVRKWVRAFGQERYFGGEVRDFYAKIGLPCPSPGRGSWKSG